MATAEYTQTLIWLIKNYH